MEESIWGGMFNSLFPIIIIWIIVFSVISNFRKNNKIKKLKSWEIPSREIKWTVSEIKYNAGWKNNSWRIISRYFIARWTNPITNEEMEFESDTFPYKDSGFKIRWMWPNQEDVNKLLEYARQFIKEWDTVKIHISNDDRKIYYIEDITQKAGEVIEKEWEISELINFSQNTLNSITKNPNVFLKSWFDDMRKKVKIFGIVMVLLFVWVPALVMFIEDGGWINLSMPKFDLWMNINLGWSKIIRIILAIIVAFIIVKVLKDYFKNSKK